MPDDAVVPLVPLAPGTALPEVLARCGRRAPTSAWSARPATRPGVVALEDVLELLIGDVRDAAADLAASRRPDRRGGGAGAGGR